MGQIANRPESRQVGNLPHEIQTLVACRSPFGIAGHTVRRYAGYGLRREKPPEDAVAGETLRFRRVFGPADRLKDWLPGQVKYVPIEPAEFERLLTLIGSRASASAAPAAAHVATAEYSAQLAGDHLVAGQAVLKVIHAGKTPALLPLEPCSLAVGKASWAGPKPLEAELGLDAEARLAALVAQSGQLQVEWSLEGRRESPEVLAFSAAIPACPVNRFTLDVPDPLAVQCDRGLVQELGWVDEGVRRWQIELGGSAIPGADRAGPRGADFAAVAVVAERDAGLRRFRARRRRLGTTGV